MQNPVLVNRSFVDFDELTAEAKHWDLDFRQLDRGKFRGALLQLMVGRIQIGEARFERALHQRGASPQSVRTFVIPATPGVRFHWRNKNVTSDDLLLFPSNGELQSVSQPDFHIYTLSVPDDLLFTGCDQVRPISLKWEKITHAAFLPRLRQLLNTIVSTARNNPGYLAHPNVVHQLEDDILSMLIQSIQGASTPDDCLANRKRDFAIQAFQKFHSRTERKVVSVKELCDATNVSERTLRYAFLEHYGVTPKAYLKAVRLNGVRRELQCAASCEIKINEIALGWGFWHMGQFASDYQTHFGELPSHTRLSVSNLKGWEP